MRGDSEIRAIVLPGGMAKHTNREGRNKISGGGVQLFMYQGRLAAFLLLSLFFGMSGCRASKKLPIGPEVGSIPCSNTDEYFPPDTLHGTGSLYLGVDGAIWESNYLRHMNEPSLYACVPGGAEPAYRFIWDRSLAQPIVLRLVEHADGAGTLFVRVLRNGGMLPPKQAGRKTLTWDQWLTLEIDKQIDLNQKQTGRLTAMFSKVIREEPKEEHMTTDGVDSIFESRVSGRYRLVDFRNEAPEDAENLCRLLVSGIANLPTDKLIRANGIKSTVAHGK